MKVIYITILLSASKIFIEEAPRWQNTASTEKEKVPTAAARPLSR
jgi:hypothetical protein